MHFEPEITVEYGSKIIIPIGEQEFDVNDRPMNYAELKFGPDTVAFYYRGRPNGFCTFDEAIEIADAIKELTGLSRLEAMENAEYVDVPF